MTWDSRKCTLDWKDGGGRARRYPVDYDGESAARKTAMTSWTWQQIRHCQRVRKSCHRQGDPSVAVGLEPPAPAGDAGPVVDYHKVLLSSTDKEAHVKGVVVGSSPSFWHCVPECAVDQGGKDLCMCGLNNPNKPHLLWTCTATEDLRAATGIDALAKSGCPNLSEKRIVPVTWPVFWPWVVT